MSFIINQQKALADICLTNTLRLFITSRTFGNVSVNQRWLSHREMWLISNFFQGRSGGKLDEYIPLQLLEKAIETEISDTQKISNQLSIVQEVSETKFVRRIEQIISMTTKFSLDYQSTGYILNPDYDVIKKKKRIWLSKQVFRKLYKSVNESESAVILVFRESHPIQEALNTFPPNNEQLERTAYFLAGYLQSLTGLTLPVSDEKRASNAIVLKTGFRHKNKEACRKIRWASCPKCQAKIEELGLKPDSRHTAEQKLQSYCTVRIEKFPNGMWVEVALLHY